MLDLPVPLRPVMHTRSPRAICHETLSSRGKAPQARETSVNLSRVMVCLNKYDRWQRRQRKGPDRKSTRLNSSHSQISYAVFFFNDTATTEIYPLSLHDALPISGKHR